MKVIKSPSAMQEISDYYRRLGKSIGFVPTMGALHEGHISLLNECRIENDVSVCSIFVNPTQFGESEDLEKYPRDFDKDYLICEKAKADYIFYPEADDMYKRNHYTSVVVSNITDKLEGTARPGHFNGVTTVVAKLMNIIKPHTVYLGQKDAQQVVVLKKMTSDLNFDVQVKVVETVREESGLAKSSRNVFLNADEQHEASSISIALSEAEKAVNENRITNADELRRFIYQIIMSKSSKAEVQYISITDNENLNEIFNLESYTGEVLISLAVKFNKTRLIDNVLFSKN